MLQISKCAFEKYEIYNSYGYFSVISQKVEKMSEIHKPFCVYLSHSVTLNLFSDFVYSFCALGYAQEKALHTNWSLYHTKTYDKGDQ